MEALSAVTAESGRYLGIKSILPLTKMEKNISNWGREYRNNIPYPHIGIDDFFDGGLIREVIANYPGEYDALWNRTFLDAGTYEEQKLSFDRQEDLPVVIQNLISALNSAVFVNFLERLSGIDGLIPDPYLSGGGLHMIPRGGRLAMHVDFNNHRELRLDRRLNLLLYLNPDWKEEWGGALELWDREVKIKHRSYLPIANRVVVFSTTDTSFHGHPDPLTCPRGHYRRSIALYYYTNGRPEEERSADHTTIWKMRPNEVRRQSFKDMMKPFIPPIVWQLPRLFKRR